MPHLLDSSIGGPRCSSAPQKRTSCLAVAQQPIRWSHSWEPCALPLRNAAYLRTTPRACACGARHASLVHRGRPQSPRGGPHPMASSRGASSCRPGRKRWGSCRTPTSSLECLENTAFKWILCRLYDFHMIFGNFIGDSRAEQLRLFVLDAVQGARGVHQPRETSCRTLRCSQQVFWASTHAARPKGC